MEKGKEKQVSLNGDFKQALVVFGRCMRKACNEFTSLRAENEDLKRRLADAECTIADLSLRMDNADVRAGLVRDPKIVASVHLEGPLSQLPQMEVCPEVNV